MTTEAESSTNDINENENIEGNDTMEEEITDPERMKVELENIIKTLPYGLIVALIKISQVNKYEPLPFETYYNTILPSFHLLRRTDGSKYPTHSPKTVRAAMCSNRIFFKNEGGLYEINLRNALNYLRHSQKKGKGYRKPINLNRNETGELRRPSNFGNRKFFSKREKITKFEKGYVLLRNLEAMNGVESISDLDFDEINENIELSNKNPKINKIIGILTVFKFFKPFLEKSFSAMKVQEQIYEKIGEINSQINCMETLYRTQG